MKFSLVLFLALILSIQNSWAQAQKNRKVVFVILDGIPADNLERVPTPNLDQIAQVGGYARAYTGGLKGGYSETPTISAVGYNSLLTGTWVNKHNVFGNSIRQPNYNYWTIFRWMRELRPESKLAIFSTWLDNRTKLLGDGLPATNFLKIDYAFDGFELDTIRFPHDRKRDYILNIDNLVSFEAAYQIQKSGPDLSWVYLEYTDDMGHTFGDSPQTDFAIQKADQQVGRIWEAVKCREKNFNEEWMILVTTDHGRSPENGKNHGGQSDRERSIWVVTNLDSLNTHFKSGNASMVDFMPSMARFLDLQIPKEMAYELDGYPLQGPLSFSDLKLTSSITQEELSWNPIQPNESVKIGVATTNMFRQSGKPDEVTWIAEVPNEKGKFIIPEEYKSLKSYKIIVEGKFNSGNVWKVSTQ